MLKDNVNDYFTTKLVLQTIVGEKKLSINVSNDETILSTRWFTCYVNVTKKNIKVELLVGRENHDYLCRKIDSYMKKKTPTTPEHSRVFKLSFKEKEFEKFKLFFDNYIFDYFEKRKKK